MMKISSKRSEVKLVYFFNSTTVINLAAFYADLPDPTVEKPTIKFVGPRWLDLGVEKPQGINSAVYFDPSTLQILYTLNKNDPKNMISIAFFGKHLQISSIEKTSAAPNFSDPNSSVYLVGDLLSITCYEQKPRDPKVHLSLEVRQKKKGGDWKQGPKFLEHRNWLPDIGHKLIVDEAIGYVFYLAIYMDDERQNPEYGIYSIQSSKFIELHENPSLQWQKYRLRTNILRPKDTVAPTYVFTENQATSQDGPGADYRRNLLMFQMNNESNRIDVATVKLRNDGSIMAENDNTVPTNPQSIDLPESLRTSRKQDLCAFIYTDDPKGDTGGSVEYYVLLIWQNNGAAGMMGLNMNGLITKTSNMGTVEGTASWKLVTTSFEGPTPFGQQSQMKGVMVASQFL